MLISFIPCWQLSLSVIAALMVFVFGGIVVSCYRGRSRLGAMLFTLAVIYGAVWADKTGHALYFGPHPEMTSAPMRVESGSGDGASPMGYSSWMGG